MNSIIPNVDHRHAIETSLDGYLHIDKTGQILDVNAAYCTLSGYNRNELLAMHISQLGETTEKANRNTALIVSLGRCQFESIHRRKNGSRWHADVSAAFSESNDGQMFGFLRDITERKRLERLLVEKEQHFTALVAATPVGVFECDANGKCVFVNQQWTEMTGLSMDEAKGEAWANALHPDDRRKVLDAWSACATGQRAFRLEHRFLTKDGKITWVLSQSATLQSSSGEATGFIATTTDITELKHLEAQVREMAFIDSLTHLANRRYLQDRLRQSIAFSKRNGSHAALLFLDLDNFKPLNDQRGHESGDQLLMEVAARLKACVRAADTIARFGGDEFVVLIGELDPNRDQATAQALVVAEQIGHTLGQPYRLLIKRNGSDDSVVNHNCSVSIGVVTFVGDEFTADEILKRADDAMYLAKKAGRNTVRFHE